MFFLIYIYTKEYNSVLSGLIEIEYYSGESARVLYLERLIHIKEYNSVLSGLIQTIDRTSEFECELYLWYTYWYRLKKRYLSIY